MTCVIHCCVTVSQILDRSKLREERLTWTHFRGFQSIMLGKAQFMAEGLCGRGRFHHSRPGNRAKMKLGLSIADPSDLPPLTKLYLLGVLQLPETVSGTDM